MRVESNADKAIEKGLHYYNRVGGHMGTVHQPGLLELGSQGLERLIESLGR